MKIDVFHKTDKTAPNEPNGLRVGRVKHAGIPG
jgi:hypothetical protein